MGAKDGATLLIWVQIMSDTVPEGLVEDLELLIESLRTEIARLRHVAGECECFIDAENRHFRSCAYYDETGRIKS